MGDGAGIARFGHSRPRDFVVAGSVGGDPALPPAVGAAVWRIVGARAAPGASDTTPEQLESLLREHLPPEERKVAVAAVGNWFESDGTAPVLRPRFGGLVADLVLDGVGAARSETAIWAIGCIAPDLVVERMRRRWSAGEMASFFDAAIQALNAVPEPVPEASGRSAPAGARGFAAVRSRGGLVAAFAWLEGTAMDSLPGHLHPTVSNLIEILTALSPDRFPALMAGLEVPAMQLTAARGMLGQASDSERRMALGWIADGSPEELVALAIVHLVRAGNAAEGNGEDPTMGSGQRGGVPEHGAPGGGDPGDPVDDRLRELLARLGQLEPPACLRWIGELMTNAPELLAARPGAGQGTPVEPFEKVCTRLAAELFDRHWSPDLVSHFQSGLGWDGRRSRVRHQAAVARTLRETSGERAATLARALLDEHRRTVSEHGVRPWIAVDGDDGKDRVWLEGLGAALALSQEELDLPAWVERECRDLPLSAWDAESDPSAFAAADRIARHWLLVALLAVPRRAEVSRTVPPATVLALAEARWEHCRFSQRYLHSPPESSLAAELTARVAVEFGRADDQWMLDQMRTEGVGPRAMWALIEEWRRRPREPVEANLEYDEMMLREFIRVAVNRFGDGGGFELEALEFWGRLWIDIGTAEQAEQAALAIASFPLPAADRKWRLLTLKLLAVVVRYRKLSPDAGELVRPFYQQLWPVYGETPNSEETDRREIDEAFGGSGLQSS